MNKTTKIKENKKFNMCTQEGTSKIVELSLKIEDAMKDVIGKENYKLSIEDMHMIAMIALSSNYKQIKG